MDPRLTGRLVASVWRLVVRFGQFYLTCDAAVIVLREPKTPSIYTAEYGVVLALLRKTRKERGITQTQVAQALGYQTSAVSKIERGQLRLDVIQLRTYCQAVGLTLREFVDQLEDTLSSSG